MLEVLVDQPAGCAMRCLSVGARQQLPIRWHHEFSLALVRRGIVVRQRLDRVGRVASIDIAGPSSVIPVAALAEHDTSAYAVDDVMLCLACEETLALAQEAPAPRVGAGKSGIHDLVRAQTMMRERVERIAEARARTAAISRVACLLLAIVDTLTPAQPRPTIPLSVQQRDLAALVALRHESVCRSLAELEARGIIARTSTALVIVDRPRLELV
jgi:CRP-like cAMP-binding protein